MSKKPILKKKKISTDATRFAHLMKAEGDDTYQDDQTAEEGEDQEPGAEGDDQEPEDPKDQNGRAKGKKAKARRAKVEEEDQQDQDAQGDDDPATEDEGDDETDAEDEDDDTTAQARARERGRCAAIFGCKAAGNNLALAAELAFSTKLPRSQAIRVLKAGGITKSAPANKPSRAALYDQHVVRQRQSLSVGGSQSSQPYNQNKAVAVNILEAGMVTGAVKKDVQL